MSQFKHRPRKRFGQHFLTCDIALSSMVQAISPACQPRVVEIGPGPGVLTAELVGNAQELTVIEIDRDLVARLKKRFAGQSIRIIEADVLLFDFSSLLSVTQPACVVGNLPYNISTPLMFRLFEHLEGISSCFFLLQKEVVDRLCANVGTKQYGRLSVMAQYYCDARSLFDVPPTAFAPPPKVDSSFVQLTPHAVKPAVANNFSCFSNVVKEAFCYRRKMLKKIFKSMVTPEQWETLGIDSTLRPEQVGVAEFVALSNEVARCYDSRSHE